MKRISLLILGLALAAATLTPTLSRGADPAADAAAEVAPQSIDPNDPVAEQLKAMGKDFKSGTTLENLMAAFNGESDANAKYTAHAKKADKDGYPAVARLFRAAARAEQIHLENHAEVIKALGGTPKADIKKVEPGPTADNLKDALLGESFERSIMYPAYVQQAIKDRRRDAVRTLNYALTAEAGHAKLYKEAGEKLVETKGADGEIYLVCPTCGYTVKKSEATFSKCPVCFTAAKTFIAVE